MCSANSAQLNEICFAARQTSRSEVLNGECHSFLSSERSPLLLN